MFRQSKFFYGMFFISVFLLILLYGFTAGTWKELDISKELLFELNINRIFSASRYTLATMPVLSTAIFIVTLLLVTKVKKIDDTKPFIIKKLMCILMIEILISQIYIQFLLVKRSININLPVDLVTILIVMGVIIGLTGFSLIMYMVIKHLKNNKQIK